MHCENVHKHIKRNKIKHDMCKSGSTFPDSQSSTLFTWFPKFILFIDKVYQKNEW